MTARNAEITVTDLGEVRVILRPSLKFFPEAYRVTDSGIDVLGAGRRVSLGVPEENRDAVRQADAIVVSEFTIGGATPERETLLLHA